MGVNFPPPPPQPPRVPPPSLPKGPRPGSPEAAAAKKEAEGAKAQEGVSSAGYTGSLTPVDQEVTGRVAALRLRFEKPPEPSGSPPKAPKVHAFRPVLPALMEDAVDAREPSSPSQVREQRASEPSRSESSSPFVRSAQPSPPATPSAAKPPAYTRAPGPPSPPPGLKPAPPASPRPPSPVGPRPASRKGSDSESSVGSVDSRDSDLKAASRDALGVMQGKESPTRNLRGIKSPLFKRDIKEAQFNSIKDVAEKMTKAIINPQTRDKTYEAIINTLVRDQQSLIRKQFNIAEMTGKSVEELSNILRPSLHEEMHHVGIARDQQADIANVATKMTRGIPEPGRGELHAKVSNALRQQLEQEPNFDLKGLKNKNNSQVSKDLPDDLVAEIQKATPNLSLKIKDSDTKAYIESSNKILFKPYHLKEIQSSLDARSRLSSRIATTKEAIEKGDTEDPKELQEQIAEWERDYKEAEEKIKGTIPLGPLLLRKEELKAQISNERDRDPQFYDRATKEINDIDKQILALLPKPDEATQKDMGLIVNGYLSHLNPQQQQNLHPGIRQDIEKALQLAIVNLSLSRSPGDIDIANLDFALQFSNATGSPQSKQIIKDNIAMRLEQANIANENKGAIQRPPPTSKS